MICLYVIVGRGFFVEKIALFLFFGKEPPNLNLIDEYLYKNGFIFHY